MQVPMQEVSPSRALLTGTTICAVGSRKQDS